MSKKGVLIILSSLAFIITCLMITPPNRDIEVMESVVVDAPADSVWNIVTDFEGAFEKSNPDHRGTEILNNPKKPFRDSLKFFQKELVGGIKGKLNGLVYDVHPNRRFRWKADVTYDILGFKYNVEEGGTIRIEKFKPENKILLSHRLYTKFNKGLINQFVAWVALNLLNMEKAASKHTLVELVYFKEQLQ